MSKARLLDRTRDSLQSIRRRSVGGDILSSARGYVEFARLGPDLAQRFNALSDAPIFLGGCGRSGTTLLLSVLSCHPSIHAIDGETRAFSHSAYPFPRPPNPDAPFELHRLYSAIRETPPRPSATRWCEKSPGNVHFFSRLIAHFGRNARCIHVVRDGRDVITSEHPDARGRYWVTPDRWIRDVSAGLRVSDHPQVTTVRYEDLILKQETTLREVCAFLDLPFDTRLLRFPETATIGTSLQRKAWFGGANPTHSGAIGRSQRPEYAERTRCFEERPVVRTLLRHYGYDLRS